MNAARRARLCTSLAAVAYLTIALWAYRGALAEPTRLLPVSTSGGGAMDVLTRWDQRAVVGLVARNADALLHDPMHFFGGSQCHPLPHAQTVGEHMYGVGLLAAVPFLATRDPVLSYNLALVLSLWIAGLSMYFFSLEFVRNPAAAFIAGLLFALQPPRVLDVAHPFVHADLWAPAALLFLHRLFAFGGWRNAFTFVAFASLVVVQSFYPLLWCTILMLFYSLYLARVHRSRLASILPQIAGSLALLAGIAWIVFGPYLAARSTWGTLSGRRSIPFLLSNWPWLQVGTKLAALAVLDRLRGRRAVQGEDPRLCLLFAGVLLLWAAVGQVPVPYLGITLPSPRELLRFAIPGTDAVRALYTLLFGTDLVLSFLAAYGVLLLIEWIRPRAAVAIVALLSVLCVAERFSPALSTLIFGRSYSLATWEARPADDDIHLIERTSGPILFLPFPKPEKLSSLRNAGYLHLIGYAPRPTSACYGSFGSPLDAQLEPLANRLPERAAADALYALGFRTVVLDEEAFWPPLLKKFEMQQIDVPEPERRLRDPQRSAHLIAYQLWSPIESASDLELLRAESDTATDEPIEALPDARFSVEFPIVNRSTRAFRLAEPIAPSDLVARWSKASDEEAGSLAVAEERVRALLPLALASGASLDVAIELTPPRAPGDYALTIAPADQPELVLSRRTVRVSAR